jgi:predicted HicB family RNase H-like nuclease
LALRLEDEKYDAPPFNLRMPRLLKRELSEAATLNCRSLNQEILYRLMRSLNDYSKS